MTIEKMTQSKQILDNMKTPVRAAIEARGMNGHLPKYESGWEDNGRGAWTREQRDREVDVKKHRDNQWGRGMEKRKRAERKVRISARERARGSGKDISKRDKRRGGTDEGDFEGAVRQQLEGEESKAKQSMQILYYTMRISV